MASRTSSRTSDRVIFGNVPFAPNRQGATTNCTLDIAARAKRRKVLGLPEQAPSPAKPPKAKERDGSVYLIQSGQYYKIGRSDELERRVKEIRIALPEAAVLVHTITANDPPGIEACWHRRLANRGGRGMVQTHARRRPGFQAAKVPVAGAGGPQLYHSALAIAKSARQNSAAQACCRGVAEESVEPAVRPMCSGRCLSLRLNSGGRGRD